jgi:hypothetical protein
MRFYLPKRYTSRPIICKNLDVNPVARVITFRSTLAAVRKYRNENSKPLKHLRILISVFVYNLIMMVLHTSILLYVAIHFDLANLLLLIFLYALYTGGDIINLTSQLICRLPMVVRGKTTTCCFKCQFY